MRLGIFALIAVILAACSEIDADGSAGRDQSEATVAKNCADPHWKEQNLGLWYSVCRQAMHW